MILEKKRGRIVENQKTIPPKEIDFTNGQLWALVLPLVIEQLLSITVGLVDSLMVASVGEAAVSAVSLVDSISNLMINIFAALATGGAVVAGRYMGRRQADDARASGRQLLWMMFWVSLVVTGCMYLFKGFWLKVLFGAIEPDVAAATDTYYRIVMASIPFMALYSGGAALFRTMHRSKITMKISLFMNILNVVGNALLIFGFGMGVEGVAYPTLVSRMAAAGIILGLLLRPDQDLHIRGLLRTRPDRQAMRDILAVGVPGGVENIMFHFGRLVITSIISGMSTAAIVANAIGNTLGIFHIFAAQSIGLGMVTVASQCVGAGSAAKTRLYTRKLMKAMFMAQAGVNLALALATPALLALYNVSAEATRLALIVSLLHGAFSVILYPPAFGYCNTLRAAGDARYVMVVSSATMWLGRILAGYLLGVSFGFGIVGVWMAQAVLDWGLRSVFFVSRYRKGGWEKNLAAQAKA